jgi:hypothetical protein
MRFLARNETNDGLNPVLECWAQEEGFLHDVYSLSFQIWDLSVAVPVQVYPLSGKQPVNVTDPWPTGDRLGLGHYVARYTVGATENKGLHEIRWFLKWVVGGAELEMRQAFDVLLSSWKSRPMLCLLSDLRTAGILETAATDAVALRWILMASNLIEQFLNREFGYKYKRLLFDGRGSPELLFQDPIIAIESIIVRAATLDFEQQVLENVQAVKVYNRHLQGMINPDDRDNPRISYYRETDFLGNNAPPNELFPALIFPYGQQNVILTGVFGYTEADGSLSGDVPFLLRQACALLAKMLHSTGGAIGSSTAKGPVVEERTRDQSVKYAGPSSSSSLGAMEPGQYTGDPAIDNLLLMFARPPTLGAT